ncbi:MAG: hypothetical protein OEY59_07455 [Deltaproteobacteria bacterium]|nr:hypothetical protein [Deltaproteobacteria bacterium]
MLKKCHECGELISSHSVACRKCGTKVSNPNVIKKAGTAIKRTVYTSKSTKVK